MEGVKGWLSGMRSRSPLPLTCRCPSLSPAGAPKSLRRFFSRRLSIIAWVAWLLVWALKLSTCEAARGIIPRGGASCESAMQAAGVLHMM